MAANEGDADYATLDNAEMLEGVKFEHAIKSSAFEDSTNLFIPYYRQAGMRLMGETWLKNGDVRTILPGSPYGDITAALDYYFENCNGGRPFIIAGHSQGSAILSLVLKGYFKEHPEYYKRMVAAYAVGYSARGTVVTHARAVPNEMPDFTGPESFHQDDYSIFYNNLKENVAKRIAAYQSGVK